jgi:hypothetical protein
MKAELTQSPGKNPAATATTDVVPTTVNRKAASLRTLGTPMDSGTLMPFRLSSHRTTFRRSGGVSSSIPHFGKAPCSFRDVKAAKISDVYSYFWGPNQNALHAVQIRSQKKKPYIKNKWKRAFWKGAVKAVE